MNVIDKLVRMMERLLDVLIANELISHRDKLYIQGEMSEAEWTGDDDE